MSPIGLEMLTKLEDSSPKMYRDQVGLPTIGIGHLLTKDELSSGKIVIKGAAVRWWGATLTAQEISDLLAQDLANTVVIVNGSVSVALTQPQFDALTSFVFNIGGGAFKTSTLLKLLNARLYGSVPNQMRRWIHSGGVIVPDLIKRRETEIIRWEAAA